MITLDSSGQTATQEPAADPSLTPQQRAGRKAAATRRANRRKVEDLQREVRELSEKLEAATQSGPASQFADRIAELNAWAHSVERLVVTRIDEIDSRQPRPVAIKVADRDPVQVDDTVHPVFAEVLELAADGEEIFLPGPTGCGKSHLAKQVAEFLGRDKSRKSGARFGSLSCSGGMSETHLFGKLLPVGKGGAFQFCTTEFLECYEKGGVFLLDEMDAADPNVLLAFNSALANGEVAVPARHRKPRAVRHPEFVCIAAANTFGTGATREYVGRNQLDLATMSRFRFGTVEMDYDRELERRLAPHDELLETFWRFRDRIAENRLRLECSTRAIVKAFKALQRGRDLAYCTDKLMAGWTADQIRKVKGA